MKVEREREGVLPLLRDSIRLRVSFDRSSCFFLLSGTSRGKAKTLGPCIVFDNLTATFHLVT